MAFQVVQHIEDIGTNIGAKNPMAVALGRLGGLKGGRARADKMSDDERSESASKAARARWEREKAKG